MFRCSNCQRDLPDLLQEKTKAYCVQCEPEITNTKKGRLVVVEQLPEDKEKMVVRKAEFPDPLTAGDEKKAESLAWKPHLEIQGSGYFLTRKEADTMIRNVAGLHPDRPNFLSDRCYVWTGGRGPEKGLNIPTWFRTKEGGVKAPYALFKAQVELPPLDQLYHCGHLCKSITGVHSRGLCVNPFHLQWQTPSENSLTTATDHHMPVSHFHGEAHPQNKYPLERILGAIGDLEAGHSISKTATAWHLSRAIVADISNGRSWNFITKKVSTRAGKKEAPENYVAETTVHKKRKVAEIERPTSPLPYAVPKTKKCGGKCQEEKDISEFYGVGGGSYSDKCKVCHNEANTEVLKRRTEEGKKKGVLICNGPGCRGKEHPVEHFAYKNREKGILRRECKDCTALLNAQTKAKMKANAKTPNPSITEKFCLGCQEVHPIAEFYMRPHGAYEPRCRSFNSKRQMELRKIKKADA